MQKKKKPSQNL